MEGFVKGLCVVCQQPYQVCPSHDKAALYRKIMKLQRQKAQVEAELGYVILD